MVETERTWKELEEMLAAGRIKEVLAVGDQITVEHKTLGKLLFDVLDFDREKMVGDQKHSVTLQMSKLYMPEMPFNTETWSNKWEESELREALAADEFVNGFEDGFRDMLATVFKKNDNREETADKFFILSLEEMTEIDERYRFYDDRERMRKATEEGYGEPYFTRSANRGNAYYTWYVYPSGSVSYSSAGSAWRSAPACVIAR